MIVTTAQLYKVAYGKFAVDTDGRLVWTRVHREYSAIIRNSSISGRRGRSLLRSTPIS